MDVAFVLWQRSTVLGREQCDLAQAAEVIKSYIKRLKLKGKRSTALYYYRSGITAKSPNHGWGHHPPRCSHKNPKG
jgi:hypothetical protein